MESKRIILACLVLLAAACPVSAQESESAADTSQPLRLKVRPSGYETAPEDAVARQERLLKRMADNDFLFRSICQSCGDAWKHNSYAPFNPMRSLKGQAPQPEAETPAPEVAAQP